ncbi:hypothetical protein D4M24_12060 [Escherichia coli]|nr:hypothetical protein D4M24_12060 [Escherichia coli]
MSAATHAQQPALFTAMLTQFLRADLSVFNARSAMVAVRCRCAVDLW